MTVRHFLGKQGDSRSALNLGSRLREARRQPTGNQIALRCALALLGDRVFVLRRGWLSTPLGDRALAAGQPTDARRLAPCSKSYAVRCEVASLAYLRQSVVAVRRRSSHEPSRLSFGIFRGLRVRQCLQPEPFRLLFAASIQRAPIQVLAFVEMRFARYALTC